MTSAEYKEKYSTLLKEFLNTEAGKQLVPMLHKLAPPTTMNTVAHVHYANMERRAGYESCEKSLIFLSNPPLPTDEIEATYGVVTLKNPNK